MDITQIKDLETFVLEADRVQRIKELHEEVMQSLRQIRTYKEALKKEKQHLADLLASDIKQDGEISELLEEIKELKVAE